MAIKAAAGSTLTYLRSYMDNHTTSYQKTMEQLSSGSKYNSIGDAPYEVCTSEKLSIQINSNKRAKSNVDLGEDVINIAESTQSEVIDNIARIRDLCLEAKTGSYTPDDKDAMIEEIRARLAYIDKSAESTKFNDITLLDGSSSNFTLQVGSNDDDTMDIGDAFINIHTDATALNIALDDPLPAPPVTGDNWTETQINAYIDRLDTATQTLINAQAQCGSYVNRLDFINQGLEGMNVNLTEDRSIISDVDVAAASANLVKYQVLQQAAVSVLAQANQIPSMALQLLQR